MPRGTRPTAMTTTTTSSAWTAYLDGMEAVRGKLLIAGPALLDPNFWRTVVLVVEHNDDAALGLGLNRPSETTVHDAVPQLEELVEGDELLYIGGPVQPSSVIVLARLEDPSDAALISFEDIGVIGTGDEGAFRSAVARHVRRLAIR